MNSITSLDIFIIIFYFVAIVVISYLTTPRSQLRDSTEHYFLAGRNLGWITIGISLFATNISSEHFVGLAGYGATKGLAVGNIEWIAIFALILLGWCFAPLFLKANVYTMPEFFGKRFNTPTRLYLSGLTIIAYILTKISISLFAGGLLLKATLGWDMYTSAVIMMTITGIYTIVGGLNAVVFTSVFQAILLIVGASVVTVCGLLEVGGFSGLYAKLPNDYFSIFKPLSDPDFPWLGVILGAPILAIWYWCTDQYIVQRILSARHVCAARNGAILTAFLKLLPVFILVLPGLIAVTLFPGIKGDEAFPILLNSGLIPTGLKGLAIVGVLSALMSSLAASFISTSTLFTMDFYRYFQPQASEKKFVLVGRLATTVMVIIGLLWIPLVKIFDNHMYVYLQSIQAYLSPPIAAVFLTGIFWKKLEGKGALVGLIAGGSLGVLRMIQQWSGSQWFSDFPGLKFFFAINFLHFAIFLFTFTLSVMVMFESLRQKAPREKASVQLIPETNLEPFFRVKEFLTHSSKTDRYAWFLSAALFVVLFSLWGVFF